MVGKNSMLSAKHLIYVLISCSMLLQYSCANGQKEHEAQRVDQKGSKTQEDSLANDNYMDELEKSIVGTWTNVSMRVAVHTFNNTDTSFMVDITEDNWNQKMNIQPITTVIKADGTYHTQYRNSFDSLIFNPTGQWFIDGDTLVMKDRGTTYKYQVFVDGNRAEFRNMIDWDYDGKKDDFYYGVQRKKE